MRVHLTVVALLAVSLLSGCYYPVVGRIKPGPAMTPQVENLLHFEAKPIKTSLPKTKLVKLSNGIKVHLLQDTELPIVNVVAFIKAGSIWEPKEKAGLAGITGSAIRSGGTKKRAPDQLDEILERKAISVETMIGEENGKASLSVLSKDLNEGLEIFADVLRNPRFDQDRFELSKARVLDSIRRENDDPTHIADRELRSRIYAGSPYGVKPTLETVKAITAKDAANFHSAYVRPSSVILGVTGDFDEAALLARLEEVFKDWNAGPAVYAEIPRVKEGDEGGVYVAAKKLPQAVIRMGHLGMKRSDPDYHASRVLDEILGGNGFASRIMQKVRVEKGLAYSAWSYNMAGRWEPGTFIMGAETKTVSAGEVINIMKSEAGRIRTEQVTAEELKIAKDSIVNSFIFIFDKPERLLEQRMIIDYYGMPDDYLETFRDKIVSVSAVDVMESAKKRLRPDGLKIVIVGDPETLASSGSLSGLGRVDNIILRDYSGKD
jgi:predicted Zn-dependent peptidase